MNATKNTFSLTRLGLLLKREYSVNWKQHVYRLLAIYGTFLVTLFLTMLTRKMGRIKLYFLIYMTRISTRVPMY